MNIPEISINRPIFIVCLFILMLGVGYLSLTKMPVDLFPDVTFPIVTVSTPYPGAGPLEVETLVSKPIEDEIAAIAGIKNLRSQNKEGLSVVIAEFNFEVAIDYAEQQVRDRVSFARRKLPDDAEESVIRRIDPADQPIAILTLKANLPEAKLFDLADQVIKPKLQQVNQVGLVEVFGGRKREIHVALDQEKLKDFEVSATTVADRLGAAGENTPIGAVSRGDTQSVYRTLAEFQSIKDIEEVVLRFTANENPIKVSDVGDVLDDLEEEQARVYVNGERSLVLQVFKQSDSNTIAVVENIKDQVNALNAEYADHPDNISLTVIRDNARQIYNNIFDVTETILIGIFLVVIVVLLFLSNFRSTVITAMALPNSLLGAFILMAALGFSINIMTLLALTLVIGLLIDDAIVVRENIFRHIEMGKSPREASILGTNEVLLAVIATTLCVVAVFMPIAFIEGMVGQFFKEFGLTIVFVMLISLFDAVTMAPMLSTYFAGSSHREKKKGFYYYTLGWLLEKFDQFQSWLEDLYEKGLRKVLKWPGLSFGIGLSCFVASLALVPHLPKTFLPPQDNGEFLVLLEATAGTSLSATSRIAREVEDLLLQQDEVDQTVLFVGSRDLEPNKATVFVDMVDFEQRKLNTTNFKEKIRELLKPYTAYRPIVADISAVGGGQRPFNLNISGSDLESLEDYSQKLYLALKDHPSLKDVDRNYRNGKPEFQVVVDPNNAQKYGVSTRATGMELRALIEGLTPAVFREAGQEYDIRVRLKEDQRSLKERYANTYVSNINGRLIPLRFVSESRETTGPTEIKRENRNRYISIEADIAPDGPGMGSAIQATKQLLAGELPPPPGVSYSFVGQAEDFQDLVSSIVMAILLAVLFIYLVLSSLYESFITPFTIMLVLPLAMAGSFVALFLFGKSIDLFSMIGMVLLLGVATKNSILLVDYANQKMNKEGLNRFDAMLAAGRVRLRPILMTSLALIAGMMPLAIGLNEASRQRTSMGVAIVGGLISSTLLALIVIPAAFMYLDRFRAWIEGSFKRWTSADQTSGNLSSDVDPELAPLRPDKLEKGVESVEESERLIHGQS
jgi:HAE1 family hydrophobic/amphiphilic exporter-1